MPDTEVFCVVALIDFDDFFEDGKVVDLYPEPDKMAAEARKIGEPPENIERFLKYSAEPFTIIMKTHRQVFRDVNR